MSATNYLGLNIPDKNSKGRVVTEVFEPNFTKLDQNAEIVDIDKNAIWGGKFGGVIQNPDDVKIVGYRYIDEFDGKAYTCIVAGSHVNTTSNYEECNITNNLQSIHDLSGYSTATLANTSAIYVQALRIGKMVMLYATISAGGSVVSNISNASFFPKNSASIPIDVGTLTGSNSINGSLSINNIGEIRAGNVSRKIEVCMIYEV